MKKITIILLILSVLLGLPVHAQDDTDPAVVSGCHSILAQTPLESSQLLNTAKSVLLYELNSDTMVFGWNMDASLDPTGMVKFMTVLVALEEGNLQDEVTVTQSALKTVLSGAVSVDLQAGEKLTLEDLLYCIMVASANDACAVVAEHIAGSQSAFVEKMNQRAAAIGCVKTVFADPHGLAEVGQTSTARELAMILEVALENEQFSLLNSAKDYTVPATNMSEKRLLLTTNHMMSNVTVSNYYDERVTGGKPAAASIKDRSMICTAESGNTRFLCVVMNAESVLTPDETTIVSYTNFTESLALLEYGFAKYTVQQVIDSKQVICQYGVSGGENDIVMAATADITTVLPFEIEDHLLTITEHVDHSKLVAPIRAGDILGSVQVSYGSVVLGSCELVAMHDVSLQGSSIRPAAPAENTEETIFSLLKILGWTAAGLVALVVIFVIGLLLLRFVRGARIRAARRRRRINRRRSR